MRVPLPRGVKQVLKRWRRAAIAEWLRRFHAFTPDDFRLAMIRLGIARGDLIYIHSSFDRFNGFTGKPGDAIKAMQEVVGESGGLMMPTQPFTDSAVGYVRDGNVTNIARTVSKMGILTEVLRRTKGTVRSIHPTHPVALWGTRAVAMAGRDWEAATPCGAGTVYEKMLDENAGILMLGTEMTAVTFYHFVEELIEASMPTSPFTAETFDATCVDGAGAEYRTRFRLFEPGMSGRRNMTHMIPDLRRLGYWKETRVGRLHLILLRAPHVLEAARAMAARGTFCYDGLA